MTQADAERYAALLQDGLALHQAGRLAEAAAMYTQVLGKFPDQPDTLDLYGVLLHQTGRSDAALSLLERAVRVRPDDAGFYNHLGVCRQALGQLDQACAAFETARSLRPEMAEPTLNLANALNQLARYDQAETTARDAMRLAPENIDARLALVVALARRERRHDAVQVLLEARRSLLPDIRVLEQLAQQYAMLGDHQAAGDAARRAVLLNPGASSAYVFLCEPNAGIEWARRAVHLTPDDARLWTNLSSRHNLAIDNPPAILAARHAMVLGPGSAAPYLNMATCAHRIFDLELSRVISYRGLVIDSSLHQLTICASECELCRGNFAKGWELYEQRVLLSEEFPRLGLPPAWDRVSPPDGALLVCAEQGVGDEFLFLSCLPDLFAIVDDVIVECDPRNLPLFQRTFPGARWIPRVVRKMDTGAHAWDYRPDMARLAPKAHIRSASLQVLFKAGMGRPATRGGYLRVEPDEATTWRSWLATLPDRPKVGLCWRSGLVDAVRAEFYFTPKLLLEAIGPSSATFISLMYVDAREEIDGIVDSHGAVIHEPPGLYQRDELDRLAALISELDIVVSVDTSVCSMAAACGVRTIRLEASDMMLTNGRDAFFDNLYPCRDSEDAFSRDETLRRASLKFREWLKDLEDRRTGKA